MNNDPKCLSNFNSELGHWFLSTNKDFLSMHRQRRWCKHTPQTHPDHKVKLTRNSFLQQPQRIKKKLIDYLGLSAPVILKTENCVCAAYAGWLTHGILYQSSHLIAGSVAPRQSANVTVIVWVCVCVKNPPPSRHVTTSGPVPLTAPQPAVMSSFSILPAEEEEGGREGKGWGRGSKTAVGKKSWASLNRCHSHWLAATMPPPHPFPTDCPTCTPTQVIGVMAVWRAPLLHPFLAARLPSSSSSDGSVALAQSGFWAHRLTNKHTCPRWQCLYSLEYHHENARA